MSNFPTLTKMGVKSLDQIERFALRHQGNTDVLKIYYKRPKGSLLSRSKKFTFVRGRRGVPLEVQNSKAFENMQRISPQLLAALEELKQLEATRHEADPIDPKEKIRSDIDHLEKVMTSKINELRRILDSID
ncbi:DUF3461 family protein [Neptunomonas sp. XY-337]|uniref:DUF3461 family protein n=1 Tax=Neptunomonas sp. XY-337 TaxID=2561897 RepID=UPI0010AAF25C|nr:DUF3461 family protein [Neptunomonas sp. XY-337]